MDNVRALLRLFSSDLAIDLGTTNTRIFAKDRGIVVNEPSAVAVNTKTGEFEAIGQDAKDFDRVVGDGCTTPNICTSRPSCSQEK